MPIRGTVAGWQIVPQPGHATPSDVAQSQPCSSWPTTWNEFLPISIPITAIAELSVFDMACLLVLAPLLSLSPAGQEHGRTIPLPDMRVPICCGAKDQFSIRDVLGCRPFRRGTCSL